MNSILGIANLDKYTVVKLAMAVDLLNWGVIFLAPQKMTDFSGAKLDPFKDPKKTPLVLDYINRRRALCVISNIFVWYLHFEVGLANEKAIGLSILAWIVMCLHAILNEMPQMTGSSGRVEYVALFMFVPSAYACLVGDMKYATLALKILYGWTLANALVLYIQPAAIDTLYATGEREDIVLVTRRCYGSDLSVMAIFGVSMLFSDLGAVQIWALVWGAYFVLLLGLVQDLKRMKIPMKQVYIWLVLLLFFAVILLV